jgi:UDP-2,3-diacylglucosamine pyrophosphatase LpxH
VFISDVHLGSRHSKAVQLYKFLSGLQCDTLYIVGDLLDDTVFIKGWPYAHMAVMRLIMRRVMTGKEVIYVPGNHDHTLRHFFGEYGPLHICKYFIHIGVDHRKWLVTHGDEMDRISSRIWPFSIDRLLPLPVWEMIRYIGGALMRGHVRRFEKRIMARYAAFDGVICGHVHAPCVSPRYVNCGDWIRHASAVVEHHDGRMEIIGGPNE